MPKSVAHRVSLCLRRTSAWYPESDWGHRESPPIPESATRCFSDTTCEFESLPLDARIAPTDVLARKAKDHGCIRRSVALHVSRWAFLLCVFGVSYPSLESLGFDNGDDVLTPVTQRNACLHQLPSLLGRGHKLLPESAAEILDSTRRYSVTAVMYCSRSQ